MKHNFYIEDLNRKETHPLRKIAEELSGKFETETILDSDGIVRWKSNKSIPPNDVLEFWDHLNKPFDFEKSTLLRKEETKKFLDEYRESRKNHVPSNEELFEMKSAFGPGQTIIDIASGNIIKL